MKLFQQKSKNLTEVEQAPFKLEKDIQSLVEGNTDTIFNLRFIKSELSIDKYRIDSLCYDEETNSLVIIEYKKGSSYSVIDQGYTYLQLLLNNKADFLLVLSQHFNQVMSKDSIDWSQSRIIFVSPSFNSFQKDSVNFKDLPFELWEIKRYSSGTVVLNPHRSTSNESISTLSSGQKGSIISSVNKEVKTYTEEEHLQKTSKKIIPTWNQLREQIDELEGVEIVAKKPYISVLCGSKTLCYVNFQKDRVLIEILRGNIKPNGEKSKKFFDIDDPKGLSIESNWEWKSGTKGCLYKIPLNQNSDIDYIMLLIKQKHRLLSY